MNIMQVLGQLDTLTQEKPNEERIHGLQSFLAREANIPYDKNALILPEYCKELHEKAVELLLRGYPGIGFASTPSLLIKLLWRRFGCKFPFQVPDFLQPDDGTAPIFDIYRRFCESILGPDEYIEHSDFGEFSFRIESQGSKMDEFLDGISGSRHGREGGIFVTNKRLIIVGPRLVNDQGHLTFERIILYDTVDTFFASADIFSLEELENVEFVKSRIASLLRFNIRSIKFLENRVISMSQSSFYPYGVPSTKYWSTIHEKVMVKEGDLHAAVFLKGIKKQKKEILLERYLKLENKLMKR